jgi:hypothetical protein
MAGAIVGLQRQDMLQQRNCAFPGRVVLNLRSSLECGQVVRGNTERMAEGLQGLSFFPLARQGYAAQCPKLCVFGTPFQRRLQKLQGLVELSRLQRRANESDLIGRGLANEQGASGAQGGHDP